MKKLMEYKGYYGTVEYSLEDEILHGKVVGINGLLSYEGETIKDLEEDFHGVVNEYLTDCKTNGITPQKSYKGIFNIRITPELHRDLALAAEAKGETLNKFIGEALNNYLHS
ncbi:putative HicB family RNase H-like nuclease [Lactobacillus colini]|uniref:HicB family RNase H-like nuclease n=1 Tax=Lactobacillus colini TaxID=1819254 RepID=A0ABS4MGV6_9LACO|nr:type II toxin-antitoxin system HicB family antitoxin [Lactobacillus colini]MBP2058546.1 putative HicB family RNase H-like nuclease [Lactobacillus colini]